MKKVKIILPYIVAGLICICVSIPVFSSSVVLDEAYSINLVRGNVSEIVHGTALDVHPPLYYLILKLSGLFGGENLIKYRIVTALAVYLNMFWLGATLVRKRWGSKTAIFYILWFGFSYITIEISTLVRMYTWGAFFVTGAALYMLAYYEKGRVQDYVTGIIMTLAAMYTHYFAVMSVFIVWAILFFAVLVCKRSKLKWVLAGGSIIAVGYFPWLKVLLNQSRRVSEHYWMTEFDWKECVLTPALLMDNALTGIGIVMYFLVFVLFLRALIRRQRHALLCMTVFVGTMVIGALLSVFVTPIWACRYMYVAWGMLSLFVAIAMGENDGTYALIPQILFLCLVGIMGAFSVQSICQNERVTSPSGEWVAFLETNVKAGDCLIADDPYEHFTVYQYYLPDVNIVMTEELAEMGGAKSLDAILKQSGDNRIWYVIDYRQFRCGKEKLEEWLNALGYEMSDAQNFSIQDKDLEVYRVGENTHE